MAVTKRNSNIALILFFLYRLTNVSSISIYFLSITFSKFNIYTRNQVFKDYFGELEEESIRDNFVVVYELLDETMDFGYPQTCESRILREYVIYFFLNLRMIKYTF